MTQSLSVHSSRIGNFALVDLLGTIMIGGVLGYYFIRADFEGAYIGFLVLWIMGIILHNIFTVDTALNMMLFGRYDEMRKLGQSKKSVHMSMMEKV